MTEKQQDALAMLNDMYHSQSKEYREQHKRNYFALVEFIMDENEVTLAPYSIGFDGSLIPNEPESDGLVDVPNLHDLSRTMLQKALERNGGDRKKAAHELGISDRTLYRRMKQYGLDKQ